jgi:hypothetical protein
MTENLTPASAYDRGAAGELTAATNNAFGRGRWRPTRVEHPFANRAWRNWEPLVTQKHEDIAGTKDAPAWRSTAPARQNQRREQRPQALYGGVEPSAMTGRLGSRCFSTSPLAAMSRFHFVPVSTLRCSAPETRAAGPTACFRDPSANSENRAIFHSNQVMRMSISVTTTTFEGDDG